ncbi:MAG: PHP domain-containing protein [Chloroflexi bacterium]|nr:PHP domain-containing protein [Chloroflexota bacterium]
MGKADLHIHTTWGDGTASVREILDRVQTETDLDVIAITDHDDLRAAWEAGELLRADSYRFEVIPGMEITTLQGHLLALFLEEPVKMLRPLEWTIRAVHEQGGLCIAPHPLSWLTRSLGEGAVRRTCADLDAIEVVNPSLAGQVTAAKVQSLNEGNLHLAETGSSDAHHLLGVGSAFTEFDGSTAADFRRALEGRQTRAGGNFVWHREMTGVMRARTNYRWRKYVLREARGKSQEAKAGERAAAE